MCVVFALAFLSVQPVRVLLRLDVFVIACAAKYAQITTADEHIRYYRCIVSALFAVPTAHLQRNVDHNNNTKIQRPSTSNR